MRTTSMVALMAMGVVGFGTVSEAQGVRVVGSASQTFRFDNNFNFGGNDSFEFRSYTRGEIGIESQTPTSRVFASTGLFLSVSPNLDFNVSTPSFRFGAENRGKLTTTVVGATYFSGPITFEELQSDLSLADQTTDQTLIGGNFAIARVINDITRGRLTGSVSRLEFEDQSPDLVPSTDYNIGLSLTRQLSDITSVELTFGAGQFLGEGVAESESLTASVIGAVTHQLDNRTEVTGNLGVAYVDTEFTDGGLRTEEFTVSALFGADLAYALSNDEVLNLSLDQSVGPSASGALELNTELSAAYEQQFNSTSRYGIAATFAAQSDLEGNNSESIFSITPNYTQQVTRDVEMQAAYTFSRDDGGDFAHGFSLEFSTEFERLLR